MLLIIIEYSSSRFYYILLSILEPIVRNLVRQIYRATRISSQISECNQKQRPFSSSLANEQNIAVILDDSIDEGTIED